MKLKGEQIEIRFQKRFGPTVFSSFLRNRIFVIPRFRGVSKVGVVHKLRPPFPISALFLHLCIVHLKVA